jgi:hypothetical protein
MVMAFLLLPGASVWEGAAAVSSNGELPEGGYYVATNSFPRNTVVEITNLETSKTIRVIVAVGLESPGLLAIVSRDAAEAIGMRNRAIGRIRMTMPSDPIAFSRFIEGLGSSGDPDFDPQASIAANTPPGEGSGSAAPGYPNTGSQDDSGLQDLPSGDTPAAVTGTPGPESPGTSPEIGAQPSIVPESPRPLPGEPPIADRPEAGPAGGIALPGIEPPPGESRSAADGFPEADSPPPAVTGDKALILEPGLAWSYPGDTPEPPAGLPEPAEKAAGDAPREPVSPAAPVYDFALVPAEERPPEDPSHGEIPRESIIGPPPDPGFAENPEGIIDPRFFIDPIERIEAPPQAETPAEPPPPIREPIPERGPVFSAPVIGQLEKGKYYLQLGAFSQPEAVELELSKIGRAYPLAVQYGGSPENPLYRILLGPVNLGESGALLQRFKGSGYRDAFIRQDG